MSRLVILGVLVVAMCVLASASYAASIRPDTSTRPDTSVAVRAGVAARADSVPREAPRGLPARSASLPKGLRALLACGVGSGDFTAALEDTTPPEKKKQVKKTDLPSDAKRKKGGEETSKPEREEEKAGGSGDSCAGGIAEVLVGSLCGAIFGGASETEMVAVSGTEEATVVSVPDAETMVEPEEFPYAGVIRPLHAGDYDVPLCRAPGDTASARAVGRLQRGASVTVVDRATQYGLSDSSGVTWVKVDGPGVPQAGWVLEAEVMRAEVAPSGLRPSESEETVDVALSRWWIAGGVSIPLFGAQDLRDEYGKNAWRAGLEFKAVTGRSIQIGGSMGFLRSHGETEFAYAGPSTTDWPVKNRLEIWDFGAHFGQLFSFAGGSGFFTYGVGPGVFHVEERADIEVVEGAIVVDRRTDKVSTWKFGGSAGVEIGGVVGGQVPIAFQTRFFVFPWKGEEAKSLTLEYLGSDAIYVFSFGVTIGVVFF